jgi:hypothetical protein
MPKAVPIRVVDESHATVAGMVAVFYWLEPSGQVGKVVEQAPIENGVAVYNGHRIRGQLPSVLPSSTQKCLCPSPKQILVTLEMKAAVPCAHGETEWRRRHSVSRSSRSASSWRR